MNRDQIIADLLPFCDIGDSAVRVTEQPAKTQIRITREGQPLKIVIDNVTGRVQTTHGNGSMRGHASFSTMLASDAFANLRRWADAQRELLTRDLPSSSQLIPVHGITHTREQIESVEAVDALLGSAQRADESTEILLIDGPAGIGKTNLIEQIALLRAVAYRAAGRPLVLHVKSRGRVLSNLQDLMAFSLQTIRSHITYDQIPVLAKHGLVVIAIDGFDELADPNGYEMAWAQLNDLVVSVRGKGTLILAGRDTFIGRTRLIQDVNVLRDEIDIVTGLTVQPPTPDQAKAWLSKQKRWSESSFDIASISVLLEEGSFALRPVFLKILAEFVVPKELKDKHERYLTPLLVNQMIHREAGLFGKPVEAVTSLEDRESFLLQFLCETAREMADSQTESLEASELSWISEAALGDGRPPEIVSLIKNRASVLAFFVNDERPGYKSFMHSYLLNYFLAIVAIDAISKGDIPKFVRRNLLGAEFLSVFIDVAAETAVTERPKFLSFFDKAISLPNSYTSADRGLRNIGSLIFSALPSLDSNITHTIRDFQIDDSVIKGTCPPCSLIDVHVSQLDCRGADLTQANCTNVRIINLIADGSTRVSSTFPKPKKISLPDGIEFTSLPEITNWLAAHGQSKDETVDGGLASAALKAQPMYSLLKRVCRMRQYWLREDGDDPQASRILHDSNWPKLSKLLLQHDYLRVETRQASGRASEFFHIKHREQILSEFSNDKNLKKLFDSMSKAS